MTTQDPNGSTTYDGASLGTERPGDRPRGGPRPVIVAGIAFFFGVGFSLSELILGMASALGIDHGDVLLPGWVLISVIMMPVVVGMGAGKLWAVRLFRWLSFGAMALYLPLLGLAFYLHAGPQAIDSGQAVVMFVMAVVKLPPLFILYRAIRTVRWLDPASLPHEWEPPYIQR
ncbi:hypothetical protein BLA39750_00753 [Burkholderia lata]|uniref:Uncharacterized protein n=1 Tax=Burkholderia lata (strain ATCC 17760 / DSM 23089 / LMG 22485 / NCIMB 9086 / R18194 / 383) TaxID=482957 RepID=A0A6P2UUB5_BURL3|nr:hypothetical protein [Burkholderia lata]VWC74152.1 hypothetical protein BLA39750_00753 [Burkholderia lata]